MLLIGDVYICSHFFEVTMNRFFAIGCFTAVTLASASAEEKISSGRIEFQGQIVESSCWQDAAVNAITLTCLRQGKESKMVQSFTPNHTQILPFYLGFTTTLAVNGHPHLRMVTVTYR
jgi:type 1 fimbria pilin